MEEGKRKWKLQIMFRAKEKDVILGKAGGLSV